MSARDHGGNGNRSEESSVRQFKHAIKRGRVTVAGQLNVYVPIKTLKSIWRQAQMPEVE